MSAVYVLMFCRITIILVFALSLGGKILDIVNFQEAIVDFRLLPTRWSKAAAWTFLGVESAIVLLMAIGGSVLLIGFLLAMALLTVFSAALVLVLQRDIRVTCNCFGRTERRISPYDVARNVLLILCGLVGVWALVSPLQSLSEVEIILIGLMAVCFVVLVTNLADVVGTLRQPFHVG